MITRQSLIAARRVAGIMRHARPAQRGTVLIMALVFLLILTILGVSAMRMSSQETAMSGNLQENIKAFEAAESGLNKAIATPGNFDLFAPKTSTYPFAGGKSGTATVVTSWLQNTQPKRGSRPSGTQTVEAANFDQVATGTTNANARSVVHQGVQIIVPKNN